MMRTTVRIDEDLFKETRKKAIDEHKPFTEILNEALSRYLGRHNARKKKNAGIEFLRKIAKLELRGGPKDLAKSHDKYTWE